MTTMMNVLDLFSGIGGFSYGLEMTGGFRTVAFCEIDPFCQKVLRKHWPDIPIFEDIRRLRREDISETVDVIVGGFPCQPVSVAGKRRGTKDNRWLWPEMLRVIKEFKPTWVIGENVAGIINMGQSVSSPVMESRRITKTKDYDYYEAVFTRQEELLLRNICQDLEEEDYEVQPLVIPACTVGAPHRRDRVWILAYACSKRLQGCSNNQKNQRETRDIQKRCSASGGDNEALLDNQKVTTNTNCLWELQQERSKQNEWRWISNQAWQRNWFEVATELCRVDDGVSHRVDRLRALGNSIVPQIVYVIGMYMLKAYDYYEET